MAVTEVSICNMALSLVGNKSFLITSLNDAKESARQAKLWYEPIRDATLQAHPWNFAVRRATLATIADVPTFGYTYAFALPADYLHAFKSEDEEDGFEDDYKVEGLLGSTNRVLVTDSETFNLKYIAKITDSNAFSPLFVQALATHLASVMCVPLTDSQSKAKELADKYERIMRMAQSRDAQEGTPENAYEDAWTQSRY